MNELTKQSTNMTLAERYKSRSVTLGDACLILDVSGSMCLEIGPNLTRIRALRDIVSSIHGNPTMFAFSTNVTQITKDTIPDPQGDTMMSAAFKAAKNAGFKKAILVTDGLANDQDAALKEVEGLQLQILYVGFGNKPEFLDKLVSKTGGYCTKQDLTMPKELTAKLQLLLGSPAEEKGPIVL